MLAALIDVLREKFPLNRVVAITTAIVTPLAAGLGGTVTVWLGEHLPLVAEQFGPDQITAGFIAGAVLTAGALVTMAYRWLEGWQKSEALKHAAASLLGAPGNSTSMSDEDPGKPLLDEPSDDLKRSLADKPDQAHRTQDRGIGSVDEGEEFSPRGG